MMKIDERRILISDECNNIESAQNAANNDQSTSNNNNNRSQDFMLFSGQWRTTSMHYTDALHRCIILMHHIDATLLNMKNNIKNKTTIRLLKIITIYTDTRSTSPQKAVTLRKINQRCLYSFLIIIIINIILIIIIITSIIIVCLFIYNSTLNSQSADSSSMHEWQNEETNEKN